MAEESHLKTKVAKGLLWGGFNNGAQQLLNLVIGIFLARILTPADYGMVGVLAIFSALASSLQEGGFISALTIRKTVTHLDYTSVFWFNISVGVFFYVLLFFLAPLIARFYDLPQLTSLARFIFLGFLFSCTNTAARAYLFRNMMVKQTAFLTLFSLLISGIVGVTLALYGYAYWGLAWQTVSYTFCITVFTYCYSKFRPTFNFSFKAIKEMFGYSSKLIVTNVFTILNNNVFAVLLGKFYTPSDVGDFNQANKWTGMGYTFINGMINGVAQPSLSKVADNPDRQCMAFRKLLRFTSFISFPAMLGLAFIAEELIVLTITDRWIVSAGIMQILCIWGAFAPLSNLFSQLILSQGRSNAYMWSSVILAICQVVAVYFSYPYGLLTMLIVFSAINILWVGVWYLIGRRKIPLSILQFIKDTIPFLILASASIAAVYFITLGIDNLLLSMAVKIILTSALYLGLLKLLGARILSESIYFLRHRSFV